MGYEQTSVKIVVDVQNRDAIDLLKKQVTDLEKATRSGGIDLTSYVEKIRDAFKASNDSSEALKAQISLWEKVRANVSATNPVYAQASAELVTLRKNLDQLSTAYTHVSESAYKASTTVSGNTSAAARSYMGLGPVGPSTAETEATAAARSKRLENVGLGIGFPLLFGGGPGSILGGGLGSFFGEGFAGQIIGSALGAKFDEITKSATDFAKSMREGGDAAGYLKQALGYLDPRVSDQISKLQQAGLTAQAAKIAFDELSKNIGEENAKAFKVFGDGWDQLVRGIQVGALNIIASITNVTQKLNQSGDPTANLNPFARLGQLAQSIGKLAPQVQEPSRTQASIDQEELSKLDLKIAQDKAEAAKYTLKDNIALYNTTQARIAEDEKEKALLLQQQRTTEESRRTLTEINRTKQIGIDYQERLNQIARQAQDEQRRQAEEQDRKSEAAAQKAMQLEKDRAQVIFKILDARIQEEQFGEQKNYFGLSELSASKQKIADLKIMNQMELEAFNAKANSERADARIKGTAKETEFLIRLQKVALQEQQEIREHTLTVQDQELQKAKEIKKIQDLGQINTTLFQNDATTRGLQSGIARGLGNSASAFAYDRARLADEQHLRYLQQILQPEKELNALTEERDRYIGLGVDKYKQEIDNLNEQIDLKQSILDLTKAQLPVIDQLEAQQERLNEFTQKYGGFFDAISQGMTSTFDLLVTGTDNWGNSLRRIASTVLQDIAKQLLKIYVIDQSISFLKSAISGINPGGGGSSGVPAISGDFFKSMPTGFFSPSANGNVFAANGIVPYAMGGIVDKPMLFPFANGIGLMGEAGPEAIMPLKRGADGKLGVAGGGGANITVNVDAKGSSVQGDGGKGNQLARVVAAAVQAEMIKQKRPGGLLAA